MLSWILVGAVLTTAQVANPVVVLDPGHGGLLHGANGVCGAQEKDVTLAIAKTLARLLSASDRVTPLLTRETDLDLSLEARAQAANLAQAALFVSIHANASENPKARGVETFFLSANAADKRTHDLVLRENDGHTEAAAPTSTLDRIVASLRLTSAHQNSQRLAMLVQDALETRLGQRSRGVLQAPFLVLKGAHMAAVLVEVGFLTHAEECQALTQPAHQEKVAQALAAAILTHIGTTQDLFARNPATAPSARD